MLTNNDIKKLKEVFATKDDFTKFATKDDLKDISTKSDLVNIATKDDLINFATKDDIKMLQNYVDIKLKNHREELINVMSDVFLTQDRIFVSREEFLELKNLVQKIKEKVGL